LHIVTTVISRTKNVFQLSFIITFPLLFRWERTALDDINWHRKNKYSEELEEKYEEIEEKLKKYKKSSVQKTEKVY